MYGKFLEAFVQQQTDLADLLGGAGDDTRFGPFGEQSWAGQAYATYQQVSGSKLGSLGGPTGLANPQVQISIVAPTHLQARRIARLIAGTKDDERLDGYRGTLGGIDVRSCLLKDERELDLSPPDARGKGPFEVQQDYSLWLDERAAAVD